MVALPHSLAWFLVEKDVCLNEAEIDLSKESIEGVTRKQMLRRRWPELHSFLQYILMKFLPKLSFRETAVN